MADGRLCSMPERGGFLLSAPQPLLAMKQADWPDLSYCTTHPGDTHYTIGK